MSRKLAVLALPILLGLSACVTVVHEREPYDAHGSYDDNYGYTTCHGCN